MNASKRLTSKSGLTIPKHLRAELGYRPGMAIDMVTTDGGLLIKPHTVICRFCGSVDGVITVEDINMCRTCAKTLMEGVAQHGVA